MDEMARLRAATAQEDADAGLVWGEGPLGACLVVVGEAPGAEEEAVRRPFVGRAGLLLNQLLAEAGISREQAYLTNVVKHRPTILTDGRFVTRAPTRNEVAANLPSLEREIAIVNPCVVLCLGSCAAAALIHRRFHLTSERGRWFSGEHGWQAMATFHPAYLARYHASRDDPLQTLTREDFITIARALERCR